MLNVYSPQLLGMCDPKVIYHSMRCVYFISELAQLSFNLTQLPIRLTQKGLARVFTCFELLICLPELGTQPFDVLA